MMGIVVLAVIALSRAAVVPVATHIQPTSGLLHGGTDVCLHGENLGLATVCRIGQEEADITYVDPYGTVVCCKAPRGDSPDGFPVQISEDAGFEAHWIPETPRNTIFKYYGAPKIRGVLPDFGPSNQITNVTIETDTTFLTSTDLDEAKCMFGDKITPVIAHSCSETSCYVKCLTPQMCHFHDPIEKEICVERTVPVYLSMNGQDFASDAGTKPKFRFLNEWITIGL